MWSLGCVVVTLGVGLTVNAVSDSDIAGYVGDALYATLLCFLVALGFPRWGVWWSAAVGGGLSWGVEFLQLAPWVGALGARYPVAHLVLGSTFNAPDLARYVVGAAFGAVVQLILFRPGRGGGALV
ncbi:uncharacterized protein DUF2809 [Actinocorallia herbida]|uniref:Uncharacterized protein DUF2809 n=1 Tax=Actinocorallia herbida TaxID=58109 RepID=A0A3N1CV25_9ACTN|nr:DUF2809 domain-containing protein [Actinocorallia herbida]ROO85153.1 uncharacterized protein DUF2809 [Actinocorallia herbida]